MIEIIAFVGEDSLLTEYGKTMRKAAWNKELPFVVFAQFYSIPLTIGLTVLAQINRHIQHPAYRTAHQFSLGVRRSLKMQTAYHTITRTTLIVLHKLRLNTCRSIPLLVIGFHKISACIGVHFRFNNQQSFNRCFDDFHMRYSKKHAKVLLFFDICKFICKISLFHHR